MNRLTKLLILLGFIAILIVSNITSYKNYKNYTSCKKELEETTKNLDMYKSKANELDNKIIAENSNNEDSIKEVAKNFINAYFNFTNKNQSEIYENIKHFATDQLVNQLKPQGDFQGDFEYTSSIDNIRMYYSKVEANKASMLVMADQKIQANGTTGTPSPTLLELNLIFNNNKWVVEKISINSLRNQVK